LTRAQHLTDILAEVQNPGYLAQIQWTEDAFIEYFNWSEIIWEDMNDYADPAAYARWIAGIIAHEGFHLDGDNWGPPGSYQEKMTEEGQALGAQIVCEGTEGIYNDAIWKLRLKLTGGEL
jgi:hypothetical protein